MVQALADYRKEVEQILEAAFATGDDGQLHQVVSSIVRQISIDDDQPQMFSIQVCHEGVTGLRYDLWAALEAAVAAVGGLAGSPGKLAIASAVIGCLLALRGVRQDVSKDMASVVLALHQSGGKATVEELALSVEVASLEPSRIPALLDRLVEIDALTPGSGGVFQLREQVFVRYSRVPRSE